MNYISTSNPLARIAVNKNEQKVYDNGEIYLQDGTEFQIMLMNTTQSTILAKISLNANSIGNGLILRPGERVWLERYFDENRKFKFETYLADNSVAGKFAIANNGLVNIDFFYEYTPINFSISYGSSAGGNISVSDGWGWANSTANPANFDLSTTANFVGYSTPTMPQSISKPKKLKLLLDSVETGRIEKGTVSDQNFNSSSKQFNSDSFWSIEYKLFPLSEKIFVSSKDLIRYCDCGKRVRNKKAKYCSTCGNKL